MLLNHARLPARLDAEGRIVTLDRQDRGLWDTREIAEGVRVLQSALAVQRPGRYQVEAAIAALHDDAASAEETDWPQILAWYDDLVALTEDPVRQDPAAVLGRAVAVGHVLGAAAGLRETDRLREVIGERHRWHAVRGAPARARRRPARRRHGVRRGRPPGHERRRARPPGPPGRPRAGRRGSLLTIGHMTVKRMDHVGVVVDDLPAATEFFLELGLERQGGGSVEGRWVDRIVGLDGVQTEFAMLQTPDGHGRLELIKFHSPPLEGGDGHAPANTSGIRHLAFVVEDIDAVLARLRARGSELVGEVEQYENVFRLCYLRGPEGIIVELAERIG